MAEAPLSWWRRLRPEDPARIDAFRAQTAGLSWQPGDAAASLDRLFSAVDELARAEVAYYDRRRGTRALISGLTRFGAWSLGSLGLLLPLLDGTGPAAFVGVKAYGYACLAGAASCLAGNALFGGTEGHIRFVSTQLELQRLIVSSHLSWSKYRANPALDLDRGFELLLGYASALHGCTLAETGRWGDTLIAELAKYRSAVDAKNR